MITVRLAFIGAIIVMAILTIGRLVFGRREAFVARKFIRWFIGYFIFNFIVCFLIIYGTETALTGPFGGWQWVLWPLILSSIGNLFSFARPMLGSLEDISAASQGRRSTHAWLTRGYLDDQAGNDDTDECSYCQAKDACSDSSARGVGWQ